jgi:hypothetical protein
MMRVRDDFASLADLIRAANCVAPDRRGGRVADRAALVVTGFGLFIVAVQILDQWRGF